MLPRQTWTHFLSQLNLPSHQHQHDLISLFYPYSIPKSQFHCNNLAEINIPEGLEVTACNADDFTAIFSGSEIQKSLALQKLLKETKPKETLEDNLYVRPFDDIIESLYGLTEYH